MCVFSFESKYCQQLSNGLLFTHPTYEGVTGVPHPHLYSLFRVFLILEFKWEQNSRMINYCGLIFEYIFLLLLAILVLSFVKYLSMTFPHLKTAVLLYHSFLNDLKNIFWIWVFCYLHVLQSSSSTPTLQHVFLIILDEEDFKKSNCSNFFWSSSCSLSCLRDSFVLCTFLDAYSI